MDEVSERNRYISVYRRWKSETHRFFVPLSLPPSLTDFIYICTYIKRERRHSRWNGTREERREWVSRISRSSVQWHRTYKLVKNLSTCWEWDDGMGKRVEICVYAFRFTRRRRRLKLLFWKSSLSATGIFHIGPSQKWKWRPPESLPTYVSACLPTYERTTEASLEKVYFALTYFVNETSSACFCLSGRSSKEFLPVEKRPFYRRKNNRWNHLCRTYKQTIIRHTKKILSLRLWDRYDTVGRSLGRITCFRIRHFFPSCEEFFFGNAIGMYNMFRTWMYSYRSTDFIFKRRLFSHSKRLHVLIFLFWRAKNMA